MESYDVAVVGLGVFGSGAAYYAAKKGAKVIGFEQFELGHVKGASHDTSRIFRTNNPHPKQVALAKSALKDWRELEKEVGHELLTTTGGIVLFPKGGPESLESFTKSMDANNLPYEVLNGEQVSQRWPKFSFNQEVKAVYAADTGMVHASKTVAALQYSARSRGAVLKEHTSVDRLLPDPSGNGVQVITSSGSYHARKVILAADAWTNKLLEPLGAAIPLTIMQEQVTYFKPEEIDGFETGKFPVWIWLGKEWFYGFPTYGEPTIKMARDVSHNYMKPEERTYEPSQELIDQLSSFAQEIIPGKGRAIRTVTCQYTLTSNRQLVMSPVKGYENIIIGLGAALGFKYAPAVGRVLAELAVDGKSQEDISAFGIAEQRESKL